MWYARLTAPNGATGELCGPFTTEQALNDYAEPYVREGAILEVFIRKTVTYTEHRVRTVSGSSGLAPAISPNVPVR